MIFIDPKKIPVKDCPKCGRPMVRERGQSSGLKILSCRFKDKAINLYHEPLAIYEDDEDAYAFDWDW